MNVYNGTCVDVISTPLLKRQAVCWCAVRSGFCYAWS